MILAFLYSWRGDLSEHTAEAYKWHSIALPSEEHGGLLGGYASPIGAENRLAWDALEALIGEPIPVVYVSPLVHRV